MSCLFLRIANAVSVAAAVLLAGCSADFYRRQADRDSYRVIEAHQKAVIGAETPPPFSIQPHTTLEAELQRRNFESNLPPEALGPAADEPGHSGKDQLAPDPLKPFDPREILNPPGPPMLVLAEPRVPPQTQLAEMLDAGDPPPPVGELVEPAVANGTLPTTRPESAEQVRIPPVTQGGELLVEPGAWGPKVRRIDLVDALRLAAMNNRPYQDRKEAVYLTALALTGRQHDFENQFFGTVDAELAQTAHRVREGSILTALGLDRAFTTGGTFAATVSNTLFEVFTDPTGKRAESAISLAISQPILRGAGFRVAAEPLVQADRNVLYAVRDFERFKRQLAVDIATEFYRVLQQEDQVANERNNYANLILARRRTQELADAGRIPRFQVDQASQDELRARNRWVSALQRYNQQVDDFRRTLGLPTDWPVVPDSASLDRLDVGNLEAEIPQPDAAVRRGLANRLDLKTSEDQVADAARRVYVAADALRAGLDVVASADVRTNPTDNKPAEFRFERGTYAIGALLDLPLDRLGERNIYRASLISLHAAQRAMTNTIDRVTAEIRQDVRTLIRSANTYRIQVNALELAEKRVESTQLLQNAGRADTRDLLEAQAALVEAQNAVTAAVVDFHIARLQLLRDMETLQVEPAGLTYHDPTTD